MQRSRYTHTVKQVFPYSQESTTGSLPYLSLAYNTPYLSLEKPYLSILKKVDLCQCSLTAGSWYLEANIAYCTQEPTTMLTLYYTVNMATIVYQFQEKLKTEGVTDLTLFTEKIDFDAEEPNLIVEEDSNVPEDTSPAVNYKEIMQSDFYQNQTLLCLCLMYDIGLVDIIHG